jgi:hypothetical protein
VHCPLSLSQNLRSQPDCGVPHTKAADDLVNFLCQMPAKNNGLRKDSDHLVVLCLALLLSQWKCLMSIKSGLKEEFMKIRNLIAAGEKVRQALKPARPGVRLRKYKYPD